MENEEIKCHGWYYNFKKGTEHCVHRDSCPFFIKDILESNLRFNYINEFRKCKKHTDAPKQIDKQP
jgi:hypothetical protein